MAISGYWITIINVVGYSLNPSLLRAFTNSTTPDPSAWVQGHEDQSGALIWVIGG